MPRARVSMPMWTLALAISGASIGCEKPAPEPDVTPLIASQLEGNSLGVRASDLKVMKNPKGEGQLVYVERTLYDEGPRYLVWLVLDGSAYTINGQTHNLTPELPFPSAAGPERWARTGLDPKRATATLDIVFPDR